MIGAKSGHRAHALRRWYTQLAYKADNSAQSLRDDVQNASHYEQTLSSGRGLELTMSSYGASAWQRLTQA
jgi:hypothetical protein